MTIHLTDLSSRADVATSVSALPSKHQGSFSVYRLGLKRVLDTIAILAVSVVVVPFVALMALMIVRDGHSPFYSQRRVGKDGRVFRMWKLRTMVPNADELLKEYLRQNPAAKAEWDAKQKLRHDPRVTPIGRMLRKTSMDEVPQLWNVLMGDMSLVGPRPMMVDQQSLYGGQAYYRLRPGITGLWQVSDRNACEFQERQRYDDIYDRIVSFRTDLAILVRTVGVVLRGTGC